MQKSIWLLYFKYFLCIDYNAVMYFIIQRLFIYQEASLIGIIIITNTEPVVTAYLLYPGALSEITFFI